MPNKYFFHLPPMWNVTSFLQALVWFSFERAPGFPAIKSLESNPGQGKWCHQDRIFQCSVHIYSDPFEEPKSSSLKTENSHCTPIHPFLGFPGKCTSGKCHYVKLSMEVSLVYPKYWSLHTPEPDGKWHPTGNSKTERKAKWNLKRDFAKWQNL